MTDPLSPVEAAKAAAAKRAGAFVENGMKVGLGTGSTAAWLIIDLLMKPDELQKVWTLRKVMNGVPPVEAMELLIGKMKKVETNIEFLMTLQV